MLYACRTTTENYHLDVSPGLNSGGGGTRRLVSGYTPRLLHSDSWQEKKVSFIFSLIFFFFGCQTMYNRELRLCFSSIFFFGVRFTNDFSRPLFSSDQKTLLRNDPRRLTCRVTAGCWRATQGIISCSNWVFI